MPASSFAALLHICATIGTTLVRKAINAMKEQNADEVLAYIFAIEKLFPFYLTCFSCIYSGKDCS